MSQVASKLADLIVGGDVHSVYQPIVRLSDRRPVGYEALARGPSGSSLESPAALFALAGEEGLTTELDWECRRAALQGALDAGLRSDEAIFVNLEPATLGTEPPPQIRPLLEDAVERLNVFVEFTERDLSDRPTELLQQVNRLRSLGIGVALDDVGADPRSLALMPFLAPEVIKLDLSLIQGRLSRDTAEIVHAVNAEVERGGALLVAEGIETESHIRRALALGAEYGQGWLFGRPGPLPSERGDGAGPALPRREPFASEATPFEIVAGQRPLRRGAKWLLLELSRSIEAQTANQGGAAVILSTFQSAEYFTPQTAARYSSLAGDAALVGALGVGLTAEPAPGVRGVSLEEAEPLRGEWDVTVIAPHFAAAFVARDLGDGGADMERRFDFALSYDRDLVVEAARAMMKRVAAAS